MRENSCQHLTSLIVAIIHTINECYHFRFFSLLEGPARDSEKQSWIDFVFSFDDFVDVPSVMYGLYVRNVPKPSSRITFA